MHNSQRGISADDRNDKLPVSLCTKLADSFSAVGKKWFGVYLKQRGEIRTDPKSKWMTADAEQYLTIEHLAFVRQVTVTVTAKLLIKISDMNHLSHCPRSFTPYMHANTFGVNTFYEKDSAGL